MTAIGQARFSRLRAATAGAWLAALATAGGAAEFAGFTPRSAAPEGVSVAGLDGEALALASDPNRTVLLHFFATWCEPCRDELPALKRFAAARAGKLRVIAISVAEPRSRVADFIAPFALGFPVALDESRAAVRAFGVGVLPSTVILAPGGARAIAASGAVDWDAPATAETVYGLSSSN